MNRLAANFGHPWWKLAVQQPNWGSRPKRFDSGPFYDGKKNLVTTAQFFALWHALAELSPNPAAVADKAGFQANGRRELLPCC
jgi:hypothetical protein